jgi:hypothetical protein
MKLTSAHALAFVALAFAVGGGFAVAHNGDSDKIHFCIANSDGNVRAVASDATCSQGETATDVRIQDVAYMERYGRQAFKAKKGFRLAGGQLLFPDNGDAYVFTAKLVVKKPANSVAGIVTCQLGSTDTKLTDTSHVTLAPGEMATLSLMTRGITTGRAGETAATEVACSAPKARYVVSDIVVAATPVNTVSSGVPVATGG